jgi:ferredoxin-like protein FixX
MAYWFLRGLRRGVVTTRYPERLDSWAARLPSPPIFHAELLTEDLAERLVALCPSRALWRDRSDLVVDIGRCTGCGWCAEAGEAAVEPSGTFELAATERQQLVKRIPIGGGGRAG